MRQLWGMNMRSGQMPAMDTNQEAGNFNGPSKGNGKKDGKAGRNRNSHDNMGGGKGGKDMQKWVEKRGPQGKGQTQRRMSQHGKSHGKGGYQQPLMGMFAQSPGPKKNKKGVGRDLEMDDWLKLRFGAGKQGGGKGQAKGKAGSAPAAA
ncbi:unnamed protein product [Symbiodinium microadriaticum]|nr:unnamed protein product [Symbiodinium microadriaticum]CAE7376530.1 unnamed protein product [Symbiodinium sp. KB8]